VAVCCYHSLVFSVVCCRLNGREAELVSQTEAAQQKTCKLDLNISVPHCVLYMNRNCTSSCIDVGVCHCIGCFC